MRLRVLGAVALAMFFVGCGGGSGDADGGDVTGIDAAVEPDSGPACGDTLCGDTCADLNADVAHCGACDSACSAGEVCSAGICDTVCPSGQMACDGGCYDLQSSGSHCGTCATSCSAGEVCSAGSCGASCGGGTPDVCGSSCVDFQTNAAFCGDCDTACATGEVCSGGTCALSCGGATPDVCASSCVDFQSNAAFCGDCDTACAAGEVCSGGTCGLSCGGGTPDLCGSSCVDFQSNATFCGDCDTACATDGVCTAGSCGCPGGTIDCGGVCVDTDSDPNNCGACDDAGSAVCGDPGSSTGVCVTGSCDFVCDAGFDDCDTSATNGCEIDLNTDAANCGACGVYCGGNSCVDGACTDLTASVRLHCSGTSAIGQMVTGAGCTNVTVGGASWVSQAIGGAVFFRRPDCQGAYAVALSGESDLCATTYSDTSGANDRLGSIWLGPLPRSCAAILDTNPSSTNGMYLIDPDGSGDMPAMQAFCNMDMGGWMLGFLKNSADAGNYGDFGATATNVAVLANSPMTASTSSTAMAGWVDLNNFPYNTLRIAAYASGAQVYMSRGIARADLRIDFGEDGYFLYGTDPSAYYWCAGDGTYTDGGEGQVSQPEGAPNGCKAQSGLGSGWDFSETNSNNRGLTMCGTDASSWMNPTYGTTAGLVSYGTPGVAYAIWLR